MSDAVDRPEPDLIAALNRVFPAVGFFYSHAENPHDRFTSEGRGIFLAVLAVRPRRHQAAPSLSVGEERGREFSDGLHVEIAERAAPRVGDEAGVRVDLLDLAIPQTPQLEQPLFPP